MPVEVEYWPAIAKPSQDYVAGIPPGPWMNLLHHFVRDPYDLHVQADSFELVSENASHLSVVFARGIYSRDPNKLLKEAHDVAVGAHQLILKVSSLQPGRLL